jgi:hypothetical protein
MYRIKDQKNRHVQRSVPTTLLASPSNQNQIYQTRVPCDNNIINNKLLKNCMSKLKVKSSRNKIAPKLLSCKTCKFFSSEQKQRELKLFTVSHSTPWNLLRHRQGSSFLASVLIFF